MFTIPPWVMKSATPNELEVILEYRLASADVARMLHTTSKTVWKWSTSGRKHHLLKFRQFDNTTRAPRAYRLSDVEEFALLTTMDLDYAAIHPALQREWKVGPYGQAAESLDQTPANPAILANDPKEETP